MFNKSSDGEEAGWNASPAVCFFGLEAKRRSHSHMKCLGEESQRNVIKHLSQKICAVIVRILQQEV